MKDKSRGTLHTSKKAKSSPKGDVSSRNLLWIYSLTLHISATYQGEKDEIMNIRRLVKGVTDGDLQRHDFRKEHGISIQSSVTGDHSPNSLLC